MDFCARILLGLYSNPLTYITANAHILQATVKHKLQLADEHKLMLRYITSMYKLTRTWI